ncbi:hypothetical protein GOP47_0026414 [Adiantum capillus-veneris]|nr:hypothetical protein GOP47_0026414 [Adiantum capillus-veneris]
MLLTISGRLDLRSLCSLQSACRAIHASLSPLLLQLPALHLLDTAVPANALKRYLESNTTILDLTLNCARLKEEDAALLLKSHLQRLHLKNCFQLSQHPHFCFDIGWHCTNLRYLSLDLYWPNDWEMLTGYLLDLRKMLSFLNCLESLSLQGQGREFDAQVFGMLPEVLGPSIKSLRIIHMEEIDARGLPNIRWTTEADRLMAGVHVVECRNLQKLSLVLSTITDTLMSILTSNLVCLTELDLQDDPTSLPRADLDLSNWGVQQVANCRNLKGLSLIRGKLHIWSRGQSSSFRRVNDLGFLMMAESCKSLERIKLGRFTQVTDTGLNSILEKCSKLRMFELIGMKQTSDLTFHDMSATSASLIVVSLPAANQITSDAAAQLACCSQLKFLNLAFCRSVGDRGLKAISYLTRLSVLDLSGADVTDFGLFSLSKSNSPLVSLSLRSCKRLTHTGIVALAQGGLPATLQALDLSNLPTVTDHTVVAIIDSGMQIVDLRLRDCYSVTDACMAALASMKYRGNYHGGSLRVLDIANNIGMTPNVLTWFQRPYFPRLQWLGLGKHLKFEPMAAHLVEERAAVEFSFATTMDVEFGYDVLSSRHREHWDVPLNEQGGSGVPLFDNCELCALHC